MHDEWDEPEDLGDNEGPEEKPESDGPPTNITQHTLLSYLVSNPDIWIRAAPIIEPVYFDTEYKRVAAYLLDHSKEYKQVPSIPVVRMKTGVLLDQYPDAMDDRTVDWLLHELETFCRHQAIELEIMRAAKAISNGSNSEILNEIYQNCKRIVEISLEKDLGIEIHKDAERVLQNSETEIIKPTKYRHLDLVTGGGFPCPGMVMFAGNAGKGKSVTLGNVAIQYCAQGDFVVYISLELPEDRIFERVCSGMLDLPVRGIRRQEKYIVPTLGKRLEISDGLFRVKKMKMSGTTTANINAYLKELWIKEGVKPKVLILDYLDLLHPRAKLRDLSNIHIKDKYCAEEVYSLCEEWNMLCITASQMVKNNAEMDPFDHATVGGGTPKLHIVDYAISLERKERDLIMRLIKGRYGGENTQIPFHWNMDTLRISDGDDETFYSLNTRFDPKYAEKQAERAASSMDMQLNKDDRRDKRTIQTDNDVFMDHLHRTNENIMGSRSEGM